MQSLPIHGSDATSCDRNQQLLLSVVTHPPCHPFPFPAAAATTLPSTNSASSTLSIASCSSNEVKIIKRIKRKLKKISKCFELQ